MCCHWQPKEAATTAEVEATTVSSSKQQTPANWAIW